MNDGAIHRPPGRPFGWWHELLLVAVLIGLLVVAQTCLPGFMLAKNQWFLSRHLWEMALIAPVMTLIMITGGIDLSVGATMGLCAVAFGVTYQFTHQPLVAASACLITGMGAGAVNGTLIARFQMHPLIVTLATYAAYRGIAEGWSQGRAYSNFGAPFSQIARGTLVRIPCPAYLTAFTFLAIGWWLSQSPGGRFLYAMGHNRRAARFSGIAVLSIDWWLYTLSGTMAGLATVVYVSRFDTAQADAGRGMELDVITAIVVGGTSIRGGRGNLWGTALGLLLIHELRLFVGRYWGVEELKPIVIGLLLIVSMLVYRVVVPSERNP